MDTEQQRFFNYATTTYKTARLALQDVADTNTLELQNERLENLCTMLGRLNAHLGDAMLARWLGEIHELMDSITSCLDTRKLQDNPHLAALIDKIPTGGRPKYRLNVNAIRAWRREWIPWVTIA